MPRKSRSRRHHSTLAKQSVVAPAGTESLEMRQMLSGNALNADNQVINDAIEQHASGEAKHAVAAAKENVEQAENDVKAATTAADQATQQHQQAQNQRDQVQNQADAASDAKQKIADEAQKMADDKQKEADEANAHYEDLKEKAQAERDAQKAVEDDIEGPAVLVFEPGGQPDLTEMTEEQLRERRRNAEVYMHNQNLNTNPSDFTARQQWGRHDKLAEIYEVDAELARREATAKQECADEAQRNADDAQACADAVKQAGATLVAEAQQKVDDAADAVTAADGDLDDTRKALCEAQDALAQAIRNAADSALTNLGAKKAQAQQDLETAKDKLRQKVEDIKKAMYFAWLLGMTPDSFGEDDLAAWKAQMDKLSEHIDALDDLGALPNTLADVISVATEGIVILLSGMRQRRLLQIQFEIQGIDISEGRPIFDNQTASEWMQDDKHGEHTAGSHDEAIRIMRILVDWHNNGFDLSRSLSPEAQCLRDAAARLEQLCDQKVGLMQALQQQQAERLDRMHGFHFDQQYFEDWAGQGEKWFRGNDGWYFVTPNGSVFQWHGGRGENLQSTQVGHVDPEYHVDPSRLHDAEERRIESVAEHLDQSLGLRHTTQYFEDWSGRGEKWIQGSDGWYFVTPNGDLFKWQSGRFDNLSVIHIAQLAPSYHEDPSRLHNAAAIRLDRDLQLTAHGSYYENWGGQNEKWLRGADGWYWLSDHGELYRWNHGGSRNNMIGSSTLIADGLDEFFSNPALLHDAA